LIEVVFIEICMHMTASLFIAFIIGSIVTGITQ